MNTTLKYKKGEIYGPDSMENLPKETNKYFSQDGLEEWNHPDYEYGTCKCIQSFKITITIKELQEPLTKNKQSDDNFNCDWYNHPDFPDTKCKTQCSTCFAANDF